MEHPEVGLKMLAMVGARLRRMMDIIEELSFSTVRERLASMLITPAENEGKQTERGVAFLLPATHQELASQLGTVRELVSRNLLRMQSEGLVAVNAREIVVRDMRGLADVLGDARPAGQLGRAKAQSNVAGHEIRHPSRMLSRGTAASSPGNIQSIHRHRAHPGMSAGLWGKRSSFTPSKQKALSPQANDQPRRKGQTESARDKA